MAQRTTVTNAKATHFSGVMMNVQILTASAAVKAGINMLELDHDSTAIAATIADSKNHQILMVKDTSDAGTTSHTVTLTSGTWDGTNTIITLDAPKEAIIVCFDSEGDGTIIENVGSVALS